MSITNKQLCRIEENRIKDAYSQRQCKDLYGFFNPGHLFMMQGRERQVLALLKKYGFGNLEDKKILEVGCGEGLWLREFIKWGAQPENITGLDLLTDRVETAKKLLPETVTLISGSAAEVPFPEASFNLVLQSTVFTSILDSNLKEAVAKEMLRVVKPEGIVLWYDYHINNPRNPDVRGIKKKEIHKLFPGCHIRLSPVTLAPPLCRIFAPHSFLICYCLEKLSFLCTHYLGIIEKEIA